MAALEVGEVARVLLEDPQGLLALQRPAMPRHREVRALHEWRQTGQGPHIRLERAARRDHRDLHRREVVATQEQAELRRKDGHPVLHVALSGMEFELGGAELELPGYR